MARRARPISARRGAGARACALGLYALSALAACTQGEDDRADASAQDTGAHDAGAPAVLERPGFCDRPGDDEVRDAFCTEEPPAIRGLEDVLALFDLTPRAGELAPEDPFAAVRHLDPGQQIVVLGHSTALSGHLVSPINPRLILLSTRTTLTFQRGVQRVEIVTPGRDTGELVFYLLSFEQACNDAPEGCTPGALYTPAIEGDWLRLAIEDDEQLKNTPSDCRQCHQRGLESPALLMRELESPWTHFFFPAHIESEQPGENGSALMRDYLAAKGDERYGGMDLGAITPLAVFNLQTIAGSKQPLLFDAPRIQSERWPWTPEHGFATSVQESPTWEAAYEAFKRGEQLALPYVELRATDPAKQAALTEAYRRYREGELPASELPDLADIFPDDPALRARIGLTTEPDASPAEALVQACGACHNDVLDQSLSRARFSIALGRMSRAEIDLAIERIERPRDTPGAMPPKEARQLAPEARRRLLEYLRGDLEPIDPLLERAAALGMRGGGDPDRPRGVLRGHAP